MRRLIAVTAVAALMVLGFSAPAGAATDPAVAQGQATRLYSAYFLRDPDLNGLKFWVERLSTGQSLGSVSQFFATSPEFKERYDDLDDGEFVDLVYQNVLGRLPDATGRAFWVNQLATDDYDRGRVMIGFSESPEYVEDTGTTPPRASDTFDDGVHTDVAAGTWRNVENGDGCTWTRASEIPPPATEVPDADIIATATVSGEGRSIVTIDEADAAFVTAGCGDWVPDIGPITLRPTEPFTSGTYRVGRDIAPGTWKASNTAVCGWARLSGFSGEDADVVEEGRASTVQTVTIDETDTGFTADASCGTWTLQPETEPEADEAP